MTERPPSPTAQFSESLSRFPADIVALVKRCLPKLRRAFPGCTQLVYNYSHSLVVAFGETDRGYEAIVALAISSRDVRLYFDKSLPDPNHRLQGAGSKVRSVVIASASELDRGDVHALIKAAIKHAGLTSSKSPSPRIIIKTAAKKKPSKAKRA